MAIPLPPSIKPIMSLNWLEINATLATMNLYNKTIRSIIQPDYHRLFITFEDEPRKLIISLAHGKCVLYALEYFTKSDLKQRSLRFVELLKSHIIGGTILSYFQYSDERIIRIAIQSHQKYFLWIKLWSGAANILLTDSTDIVIDAYYRRPSRQEISQADIHAIWLIPLKQSHNPFSAAIRFANPHSIHQLIHESYCTSYELQQKQKLQQRIIQTIQKRIKSIEALINSLTDYNTQSIELLKIKGELLLRYAHTIRTGAKTITLPIDESSPLDTQQSISIALDPSINAIANANNYFQSYKKKQRSIPFPHKQIIIGKMKISLLLFIMNNIKELSLYQLKQTDSKYIEYISTANNIVLSDIVKGKSKELHSLYHYLEKHCDIKQIKQPTATIGRIFHSKGYKMRVGRNAKENDILIRSYAKPYDYWMHARGIEGSHVIIHRKAKAHGIPLSVLFDAAHLSHYYSKARKSPNIDVHYTEVKYLKKPKGAKAGTVLAFHDKSLQLRFQNAVIKKLQDGIMYDTM